MTSVIGLDIGNLQAKIGLARNRGIDIIANETSNRATPALISFGTKSRAIGEAAKTQETSNYRNTIGSLKRLIGRTLNDSDVQNYEKKFINAELIDVRGTVGVRVDYLQEQAEFSATQLYATYLAKLRDIAHNESKAPVNNVVIAVPGWYSDIQRRAVLDAADIAGLNALKLINEGTAIAFGYGITKQDLPAPEEKPRIVAFVDIGHSDYSVTVAAFSKNGLSIKAAAHDRHFGGRDFDYALVEHFAHEFTSKYKIDVLSNKKAIFRLQTAVEKLKKILSANLQAPLNVESIMNDIDAASSMTREQFEELIQSLLDRAIIPLETALAQSGLKKEDIDAIELVGGSTRIPALKSRIQDFFGRAPSTTTNQDEAVARGATLACATLSPVFRVREFSMIDAASFPIDVTWDRVPEDEDTSLALFTPGNAFPSTKVLTLQRNANFDLEAVYPESANLPGSFNRWISKVTVKDVRPSAEGQTCVIKVKCRLNEHGIFNFESAILHETSTSADNVEMTENAGAEANNALPDEKESAQKLKKTTTKRELPIIVSSTALDRSILEELRGKEGEMHANDKLVVETEVSSSCMKLSRSKQKDRKNALEEYIYDMRDKVDGSLAAFAIASDKEALKQQLVAAEDWLYSDEGEDGAKSAYVAKLDGLRAIGGPIALRFKESEERPAAVRRMKETIAKYNNKATGTDERYSHIPEEERSKVLQKLATEEKWLDDQTARQAERAKSENPIVSCAEILKRREELSYFCNGILNRAKPANKTPAPKEEATPAPAKSETATEDIAGAELPREDESASAMDVD